VRRVRTAGDRWSGIRSGNGGVVKGEVDVSDDDPTTIRSVAVTVAMICCVVG